MQATHTDQIEAFKGKYRFYIENQAQLNQGLQMINWRLGNKRRGYPLTVKTISRNGEILYARAYSWDYNDDWDGQNLKELVLRTTLGVRGS